MTEDEEILEISGTVSSGLGKARDFILKKGYADQIKAKLSFIPYPGTLNMEVPQGERGKVDLLKKKEGILIRGFTEGTKTFGDVLAFRARFHEFDCGVLVPKLSTHTDKIEVIAEKELRKELKLMDGEKVTVRIILS